MIECDNGIPHIVQLITFNWIEDYILVELYDGTSEKVSFEDSFKMFGYEEWIILCNKETYDEWFSIFKKRFELNWLAKKDGIAC